MRGKRFFNPLILQTFSSIFKHAVGNILPSFPKIGHPIAALALACVSVSSSRLFYFQVHNVIMKHKVERAVRIWGEGSYDANTGKIVAKINPLSNRPSKETAFSSALWADATNKYVSKITTLNDDIWEDLMDAAMMYGSFTWENFAASSSKNSFGTSDAHAADRDRALFSDED
jgi:hypothetical protein